MKIATMATGGIGGYLAVRLAQAGAEVATIARGTHLAAIREGGLTLVTSGVETRARPWMATDDPGEVGEVDAVIFGVKADDLESAAEACQPMIGAHTVVVPFLNGVEAAETPRRDPAVRKRRADGVAYISTTISAPGTIQQTGDFSRFVFGERDNRPSPRLDALRTAMTEAGVDAPPTDDVEREIWTKFILFAAVSGVTAAGRCTLGDVHDNAALAEVFRGVIAEDGRLGARPRRRRGGHHRGGYLDAGRSHCRGPCARRRPSISNSAARWRSNGSPARSCACPAPPASTRRSTARFTAC